MMKTIHDELFQLKVSKWEYVQLQQAWSIVHDPWKYSAKEMLTVAKNNELTLAVEFLNRVDPDDYQYAVASGKFMLDIPFEGTVILTRSLAVGHFGASVLTNVPRTCISGSPTGHEYGYGGSGPSDLALDILNQFFPPKGKDRVKCFVGDCSAIAWEWRRPFGNRFIFGLEQQSDHAIPLGDILNWFANQKLIPTKNFK